MPAHYLDSSGLVKRYISETGTGWVRQVCATGTLGSVYIAQIAGVETVAAIARRVRQRTTTASDGAAAIAALKHQLISDYTVVGITDVLLQKAMDLVEKHGLRGYDAVQLASALQVMVLRQASGLSPLFSSPPTQISTPPLPPRGWRWTIPTRTRRPLYEGTR